MPPNHFKTVNVSQDTQIQDNLHESDIRYTVAAGVCFQLWLDALGGQSEPRVREIVLAEPGARAEIRGVFSGRAKESLRLQLDTIHQAPHTTAATDFRAVLRDAAVLVFRGMIKIAPGAQGSHDFLRQDSLILSDEAKADSIPGLEIEANDVKASHGATAKPLDPEMIHYVQSRGVPASVAETMLIESFLQPVRFAKSIVGS